MANECLTEITFYSKSNPLQLQKMYQDFQNLLDTCNAGYGEMRNFASHFFSEFAPTCIDCAGEVDTISKIQNRDGFWYFSLFNTTSWNAKMGFWNKIVCTKYPDVQIAYLAEEPGNEYFFKYDETNLFYPEQYYLDICYIGRGGDLECNEDRFHKDIQDIFHYLDQYLPFIFTWTDDLEKLGTEIRNELEKYSSECFFYIAKWKILHPENFDFFKI